MEGKTPAIVLAAGASSRMGTPKALLPWGRHTVLEHQLEVLKQAGYPNYVVVTGAHHGEISQLLEGTSTLIAHNWEWHKGMGTSIGCGMAYMQKQWPDATGVLILLADQPLISAAYLRQLREWHLEADPPILVASRNPDGAGVPALFPARCFKDLSSLPPGKGARKLIAREVEKVRVVDPGGAIRDMDTPEMYLELLRAAGLKTPENL
ncbi:nucleotidyltransferase family protein [Robiginitalea sp. M366]|uniref:nucleotidyltransferase family protein n=1 Tax=Robiginitalea aestuariiviva TaxID=3036903 RepID=UPI00240D606A|nr:nucleotidyltransferase family protein [Robiginitalea aestuariiviva]MDG1572919.1 nucleotidyltransferase family protein [Robiginitalea aestuariiviva]